MPWPPPPNPDPTDRYGALLPAERIVWECRIFTLGEVAGALGYESPLKVRSLIMKGYLRGRRGVNGRQLFVVAADLLRFIDRYMVPFDWEAWRAKQSALYLERRAALEGKNPGRPLDGLRGARWKKPQQPVGNGAAAGEGRGEAVVDRALKEQADEHALRPPSAPLAPPDDAETGDQD